MPCPTIRDVNCVCQEGDCVGRNLNRQHHFSAGHLALFQHSTSMSDRWIPKKLLESSCERRTILPLISRMLILDLLSLSKNHTAAALVRPSGPPGELQSCNPVLLAAFLIALPLRWISQYVKLLRRLFRMSMSKAQIFGGDQRGQKDFKASTKLAGKHPLRGKRSRSTDAR